MSLILSPSIVAITTRHYKPDKKLSILPACSTLTIQLNRENNWGLNNSISWYLPLYKILFVDTRLTVNKINASSTGKISLTKLLFNSMTLIQPWVLLNYSESWSMNNILIRKLHGTSFMTPFLTPIIQFFPKHFKSGVFTCLKGSFPGIWNLFTLSTTSGLQESPKSIQEIHIKWTFCPWLKKPIPKKSEWPIFVLSVPTKSTVLLICILSYSSKTCSRTSMRSSQTNLSTRLMELLPEDGCCAPIPGWQICTLST